MWKYVREVKFSKKMHKQLVGNRTVEHGDYSLQFLASNLFEYKYCIMIVKETVE